MLVRNDVVEKTWAEVGEKVRPMGRKVMVRTLPLEPKIPGSSFLFLPPNHLSFYYGFAHQRIVPAVVLSINKKARVKPGEVVCFQRLYFIKWKQLEDQSFIGWIEEPNLAGYIEEL